MKEIENAKVKRLKNIRVSNYVGIIKFETNLCNCIFRKLKDGNKNNNNNTCQQ